MGTRLDEGAEGVRERALHCSQVQRLPQAGLRGALGHELRLRLDLLEVCAHLREVVAGVAGARPCVGDLWLPASGASF